MKTITLTVDQLNQILMAVIHDEQRKDSDLLLMPTSEILKTAMEASK